MVVCDSFLKIGSYVMVIGFVIFSLSYLTVLVGELLRSSPPSNNLCGIISGFVSTALVAFSFYSTYLCYASEAVCSRLVLVCWLTKVSLWPIDLSCILNAGNVVITLESGFTIACSVIDPSDCITSLSL